MRLIRFITTFVLLAVAVSPAMAAEVTLAWDANDPVPTGYALFERHNGMAGYTYEVPIWPTDGLDHQETTATIQVADDMEHAFVVRAYVKRTMLDGTETVSWSGDSNEVLFMPEPAIETPKNLIMQAIQYLSQALDAMAKAADQLN